MAITGKQATKEEVKAAEEKEQEKAQGEIEQVEGYDVHTIIRGINMRNQFGKEDGSQPASVVDAYVAEYLNRGYRLAYVRHLGVQHFEGTTQVDAINVMYVLVREPA